jgi:membrane-associated phospholipid phosphatase
MTVTRRATAAALGLVVAVCCALATFAVHRVFVGTQSGQAVDQAPLEWAATLPVAVAEAAQTLLSLFTVPVVAMACLVPVVLAAVRRTRWHALAALVLVAGANTTTQVLKDHVFERPDLLALGAPNSLPSGHTTVVASVALGLALIAPSGLRRPVAVSGLAGSVLVGLATVVAGWHRLSDVAAALLVSLSWAGLVLALLVLRPRPEAGVTTPVPARRTGATAHR